MEDIVGLSTTKAKYVALNEMTKEIIWLKGLRGHFKLKQNEYVVHCDNQSTIHLEKNATYHSKMKHKDVRYHVIRVDVLDCWQLIVEKVHAIEKIADMFTKVVPPDKEAIRVG